MTSLIWLLRKLSITIEYIANAGTPSAIQLRMNALARSMRRDSSLNGRSEVERYPAPLYLTSGLDRDQLMKIDSGLRAEKDQQSVTSSVCHTPIKMDKTREWNTVCLVLVIPPVLYQRQPDRKRQLKQLYTINKKWWMQIITPQANTARNCTGSHIHDHNKQRRNGPAAIGGSKSVPVLGVHIGIWMTSRNLGSGTKQLILGEHLPHGRESGPAGRAYDRETQWHRENPRRPEQEETPQDRGQTKKAATQESDEREDACSKPREGRKTSKPLEWRDLYIRHISHLSSPGTPLMKWTSWVRSWRSQRGGDEWGTEWGAKMGYGQAGGDGDAAEARSTQVQHSSERGLHERAWRQETGMGPKSRLLEKKTGPKKKRLTTIHKTHRSAAKQQRPGRHKKGREKGCLSLLSVLANAAINELMSQPHRGTLGNLANKYGSQNTPIGDRRPGTKLALNQGEGWNRVHLFHRLMPSD
ncbi:hypothetical protein K438DRAFT_1789200 [Mycena galopus ATCC 62051]|nr:hypothetical protein K438DRAFT_1789200 [Mycena galopus ATCC 62051]